MPKDKKSPSQRLRAVLYLYWEQNTNRKKPFKQMYEEWMEKKINEIIGTLN